MNARREGLVPPRTRTRNRETRGSGINIGKIREGARCIHGTTVNEVAGARDRRREEKPAVYPKKA